MDRASATAGDLTAAELIAGAAVLERKVHRYEPACVTFVGITAYRTAFGRKSAKLGPQKEKLDAARIWVLPNPSGLNAHFGLEDFVSLFRELREAIK